MRVVCINDEYASGHLIWGKYYEVDALNDEFYWLSIPEINGSSTFKKWDNNIWHKNRFKLISDIRDEKLKLILK